MDGYWAFEMERRGAASVTALDLEDPEQLDWPASLRAGHDKTMDETKAERFALAKQRLGSNVKRVLLSAYDLSPELGTFEFVFCGDLLLHLKDPITPVENIRSVCTESAVIANVITRFRFNDKRRWPSSTASTPSPGGRPTSRAWCESSAPPAFRASSPRRPFELPYRGSTDDWKGLRGVVSAYV